MEIKDLVERFSKSRPLQEKAIFSSLFIISNELQTFFDQYDPKITLKQFMLMTIVKQSEQPLTFTKLGALLGCSRQNIKKLAVLLEQKEIVKITTDPHDNRASIVMPTPTFYEYFDSMSTVHTEILAKLFEHYSDEELSMLFKTLTRLHEGVEQLRTYQPNI